MRQTSTWQDKFRQFLIIFFPIFITQLSLSATAFVDTVMAGQAGKVDLAGVAIGVNIWIPIYTGLTGVFIGITPILAQLHGARNRERMPFVVVQGLYLAVVLSVGVILGGYVLVPPVLTYMGLVPEVHHIALHFLIGLSIGIMPLYIAAVLRNFIDSLGYTRMTMLITLSALPINVLLNYLLIFGQYGFPRLGGIGAGYASALTYWYLVLCYIFVTSRIEPFKGFAIFATAYSVSWQAWKEQLKIGLPIGFAIFSEVSIFGVVALLMAGFGTDIIAAHQAAINFSSLVYMLPLSIGMALTIVVGFEVGAKRLHDARQYSYLGIGLAVIIAVICASGLFFFMPQIARLYSNDTDMLQLIENFLLYAVFFQMFDAVAAPIQGILRGYKDVTVTFLIAVISYWVIGMPVGYLLAAYTYLGPYGYWAGFIAGLGVGAVALLIRLLRVQKRLAVDAGN